MDGQKLYYLTRNYRICFEVDEFHDITKGDKPCSCGVKYRSVIVKGKAKLVLETRDKLAVFKKLIEKYT